MIKCNFFLHCLCITVSLKGFIFRFVMLQMESMKFSLIPFWSGLILPLDRKAWGKRECQGNTYPVERNTCNNQLWLHRLIQKQQLKGVKLVCLFQSKRCCDTAPCRSDILRRHPYSFQYCSGCFLRSFSFFVNNNSASKQHTCTEKNGGIYSGFCNALNTVPTLCSHVKEKRQMPRTNKIHPSLHQLFLSGKESFHPIM